MTSTVPPPKTNMPPTTTSSGACPPALTMKLVVDTNAGKDVADFISSLMALPLRSVANLLMAGDDGGGAALQLQQLLPLVQGAAAAAEFTVADDLTVEPNRQSALSLLTTFGVVNDIGVLREKTVRLGRHQVLEILRVVQRSKTVLTDVFLQPPAPGGAAGKQKPKRRRSPILRSPPLYHSSSDSSSDDDSPPLRSPPLYHSSDDDDDFPSPAPHPAGGAACKEKRNIT